MLFSLPMNQLILEGHQVWIYLVAIAFGLGLGIAAPDLAPLLDSLLWPVPLLALAVGMIAAAQVKVVWVAVPALAQVFQVYLGFLLGTVLLVWLLARLFKLPVASGRTLAFSLGTRNSFVVLPLAVALPTSWETTVAVIVFQSLVELFGMVFCLWWIPHKLFVQKRPLQQWMRW